MGAGELSPEHYLLILSHRKWFILTVFLVVSCGTAVVSRILPDVYTSETLILVDPQQVPSDYVKPTVVGDVRNRLGTLSQQILSVTRLQRIIETFNLYPEARRDLAQEDVINRMREDISIQMIDDAAARRYREGLQAFKISYSGNEPRMVAQVTNELASLFIEENLKARERVAAGTTEFISNQLVETERKLVDLEARLRDYKLQHAGELPDQQAANLQILGQQQSRLQMLVDSQNRAEQQKSYLQAILAAQAPTVEPDEPSEPEETATDSPSPNTEDAIINAGLIADEKRLAELRSRYGDRHPDVVRLQREVEETRALREKAAKAEMELRAARTVPAPVQAQTPVVFNRLAPNPSVPGKQSVEGVLAQIGTLDSQIAHDKREQERILQSIATYQRRVEAIPIREQEIADLARDYQMTKEHYSDLLSKQMSAQQATELEARQKGERFTILDPAQVPERPSRPNRILINALGSAAGLGLGIILALITEFLGFSITQPQQIFATTGITVLGVIPMILTHADRMQRRRRMIAGTATGVTVLLAAGAFLIYHYRILSF
jgi:polysaccharide chain length determinant protein (PEP-CTERM system associated)